MSQRVYIDQTLQPIRKPWIWSTLRFVLEVNSDSGSWAGKIEHCTDVEGDQMAWNFTSIVTNHPTSPLSKIAGDQSNNIFTNIHIGMIILRKSWFMRDGPTFSQHFINEKVASMPKRLDEIITGEGKMTAINCSHRCCCSCSWSTWSWSICGRRDAACGIFWIPLWYKPMKLWGKRVFSSWSYDMK